MHGIVQGADHAGLEFQPPIELLHLLPTVGDVAEASNSLIRLGDPGGKLVLRLGKSLDRAGQGRDVSSNGLHFPRGPREEIENLFQLAAVFAHQRVDFLDGAREAAQEAAHKLFGELLELGRAGNRRERLLPRDRDRSRRQWRRLGPWRLWPVLDLFAGPGRGRPGRLFHGRHCHRGRCSRRRWTVAPWPALRAKNILEPVQRLFSVRLWLKFLLIEDVQHRSTFADSYSFSCGASLTCVLYS
jgi:hypothetical protein